MKSFAVIGDPVAHSWSPDLHRTLFLETGMKAEYRKIPITRPELETFVRTNTLAGYNVTIPHKEAIIPYLDSLDDHAVTLQAVNCVVRSNGKQVGYNTDWLGFKQALEGSAINLAGYYTLLLGAGGAARAVAYALNQFPVQSLFITNRSEERASILTHWVEKTLSVPVEPVEWRRLPEILETLHPLAVINTTPVGMWPVVQRTPIDIRQIKSDHVLIDVIYNPPLTSWLKSGQKKGCTVLGGLEMFIHQGMASGEVWFGPEKFEKIDLNQIRKVLISLQS